MSYKCATAEISLLFQACFPIFSPVSLELNARLAAATGAHRALSGNSLPQTVLINSATFCLFLNLDLNFFLFTQAFTEH